MLVQINDLLDQYDWYRSTISTWSSVTFNLQPLTSQRYQCLVIIFEQLQVLIKKQVGFYQF